MSPRTAREAIDHVGDRLQAGGLSVNDVASIAEMLLEAARHDAPEVRKATAHALLHLRHDAFAEALAVLARDSNTFVREAAERTAAKRVKRSPVDHLSERHGGIMDAWLQELSVRFGDDARRLAQNVAEQHTDLIVREAYHEIIRVVHPLEGSHERLAKDLEKRPADLEAAERHLGQAAGRLRLLIGIVKAIRAFNEKVKIVITTVSVRDAIREAALLVRDDERRTRKKVSVEVDVDRTLDVEADRTRIVQALRNVIENAYQALESVGPPRRIDITARLEGNETVAISIQDNGPGMSKEALADAFEFPKRSLKIDGTGFGLPFFQKVIESEHGGRVELASDVGKGTIVTARLPLRHVPS